MNNEDEIPENDESDNELYDADPDCDHQIIAKWSGVECSKCGGWFCF
jgi:hypothetical protein